MDDVERLRAEELPALVASQHRIGQENLPVMLACAGLPSSARLVGDAKPYAERLFRFFDLSRQHTSDCRDAAAEPPEGCRH